MPESKPDNQTELFKLALGLQDPWVITSIKFSQAEGRLDIYLSYDKGSKFKSVCCQELVGIYDSVDRTWRHLNFFQYETYLHAKLPRVQCKCGKVNNVSVPWARPNSGFTLLFEAFVMELAGSMPLSVLSTIVNEHDTRLMRIIKYYVSRARKKLDMSKVKSIGIDETSKAKGHDYVTVFIDTLKSKVLFVTEGKDSGTIKDFSIDLREHNGNPNNIKEACIDLSPAFKKGVKDYLPNADIVFDRFHVMKIVNEALDKVRQDEQKNNPLLKGSKYAWLHNPETTTEKQSERLNSLTKLNLKTTKAYQIRLALRDIYEIHDSKKAESALKKWYFWVTHSKIEQMIKIAKTIKNHWDGIMAFFNSRISNGPSEGINSVIQTIKRRARGYKNSDNFITMIYLSCSKLQFELPAICGAIHYR